MRTILFSCKHNQILPYFAHLFNKYYDDNMEVIVLSPEELPVLPDNFSHFKLSSFSRSWVNDISEFFDQFQDDYFFSLMQDHFLYASVQKDILKEAEKLIQENSNIYKFGCRIGPIPNIPRWALDSPNMNFGSYLDTKFSSPCPVKQSLLPSLWKTKWFKILLDYSKNYSAWEWELRPKTTTPYLLEPEIRELIKDKQFLFYQTPEVFPCIDLIRGGADNYSEWSQLVQDKDDIDTFSEARKAVFN